MAAAGPIIIKLLIALVIAKIQYDNQVAAQRRMDRRLDRLRKSAGGGHLATRRSSQALIPLVYGKTRVGLNEVYLGTSGADNRVLHIVGEQCEGPIQGIAQEQGVYQIFLNDKIYTDYGSLVSFSFKNGASDQTSLTGVPDGWNDPLRYTAHLHLELTYDKNKFQNKPEVTVIIEGLEDIYDPETDTSGYSNNSALCAYNFMTRPSTRGGMGIDPSRIDTTSVIDAKNYCITKGWTCNLPIIEDDNAGDILDDILITFRGQVIYSEGKFKMRYLDLNYEAIAMSLDESDILSVGNASTFKANPQSDIFDRPNAIRIKYLTDQGGPDGESKYQVADYVLPDSDAIAEEGDYREKTVAIFGMNNLTLAQPMAGYLLERIRHGNVVSFIAGQKTVVLEPHDLIQLTLSAAGWQNKIFRVVAPVVNSDMTVSLSLIEEDAAFYDDVYNTGALTWFDTTLPSPSDTVYGVINVSHQEEVYSHRNRSFTRWKIYFDPPAETDYPW